MSQLYDGPIIDSHHHLWHLGEGQYPWLERMHSDVTAIGTYDRIRKDYLIGDYAADVAGQNVIGSVHVEALPKDPVSEVHWVSSLAKRHHIAERLIAAGDVASPEFPDLIRELVKFSPVVGVRSILSWHPTPALRFVTDPNRAFSPRWVDGIGCLAEKGLILELMMYPYQAPQVFAAALTLPQLTIVINHCASPIDRDAEGIRRWRMGLELMSRAPNIHVKVSNPGVYVPRWKDTDIVEIIRACINAMGHERVMFGTDLPVSTLHTSTLDIFRLARAGAANEPLSAQEKFFYQNAKRIYRMR